MTSVQAKNDVSRVQVPLGAVFGFCVACPGFNSRMCQFFLQKYFGSVCECVSVHGKACMISGASMTEK